MFCRQLRHPGAAPRIRLQPRWSAPPRRCGQGRNPPRHRRRGSVPSPRVDTADRHLEPARYHAERYKRTGEILPDSALEEFKKFDSIFLGAIGHPDVKPGILEVGILLKTRFALDQYINLRPVKLYPNVETPLKDKGPSDIDFVVVRENTGGIYTGIGGVTQKGTPLEVATQVMQYSRPVINRVGSRRALLGAYHRGKAWKPSQGSHPDIA